MEKPPVTKLNLTGIDGNAFMIIGSALRAARKAGWTKEQMAEYQRLAKSVDYDNLLAVTMEWFDVD